MKLRLLCAVVLLVNLLTVLVHAGTVNGTIQRPNGQPLANGIVTFSLSQAGVTQSGSITVTSDNVYCGTSSTGTVVGITDPAAAAVLSANYGAGTLPATQYFIKYTYTSASGESAPSPETTFLMTSTGTLNGNAPTLQPGNATGYKVYIGTTSGGETLQQTIVGFGGWSQSTTLAAGAAPPVSNSTQCNTLIFNDAITPSYTTYLVNLLDSKGKQVAGYPQRFYFSGATVDLSNMAPAGNLYARFPNAIVAQPGGNGLQSIAGPLSLGTYNFFAGNATLSAVDNILYVDGVKYATIQAAINALPSSGGTVIIPPGTYALTDTVLNKSNVTVRGSGMGTHIQPSGGAGHYAFVLGDANPSTVSSLQVRDLEIDCPGGTDQTGGIFVRKGLAVGTTLDNIKFRGLAATNGSSGTVGGSCGTDVQWGETAGGSIGSFEGVMSRLDIDLASTQIGIHISNGPNGPNGLTIERCSIRNGSLDPGLSQGILIEGQAFRTSIINNYIEFMPGGNIVLRNTNGTTGNTIISNNYMETFGTAGLLLDIGNGVIDTVYRDNYTNSNSTPFATYDIQIANGATGVLIENTRLQNHGTAAIHNLNASASANIILRNVNTTSMTSTLIDSMTGVLSGQGTITVASGSATVDLASVASAACTADSSNVTVTGAAVGDPVRVAAATALPAGVWLIGRVTAADTGRFQLCNLSGGAVDRASDTYTISVVK